MSYARWGWDGSHVYVFGTVFDNVEQFECCGCWLNPAPPIENAGIDPPEDLSPLEKMRWHGPLFSDSWRTPSRAEMVTHLLKHREAGHTVPQDCIDEVGVEREWGVA